jgi:serine/threonine protein kinase
MSPVAKPGGARGACEDGEPWPRPRCREVQLRGRVCEASDVFAAGLVFLYLHSGAQLPGALEGDVRQLVRWVGAPPTSVRCQLPPHWTQSREECRLPGEDALPAAVAGLVKRMLAWEPRDRPTAVEALGALLQMERSARRIQQQWSKLRGDGGSPKQRRSVASASTTASSPSTHSTATRASERQGCTGRDSRSVFARLYVDARRRSLRMRAEHRPTRRGQPPDSKVERAEATRTGRARRVTGTVFDRLYADAERRRRDRA